MGLAQQSERRKRDSLDDDDAGRESLLFLSVFREAGWCLGSK